MEKIFQLQQEIGAIAKDVDNPFYKSKYFDINKIIAALKPILKKHKLVITQPLNQNVLETVVYDAETGERLIDSQVNLPDLQDPQKMGSAITYFRRYSLQSLLLLEAEDDDANTTVTMQTKQCIICKKQHNGAYDKCFTCYKDNQKLTAAAPF